MAVATDELADGVLEVVLRITFAHIDREEMGAAILELLEHGFPAAVPLPVSGDSQEQEQFPDARPIDKGEWLLHGHVHNRWSQNGRMVE